MYFLNLYFYVNKHFYSNNDTYIPENSMIYELFLFALILKFSNIYSNFNIIQHKYQHRNKFWTLIKVNLCFKNGTLKK